MPDQDAALHVHDPEKPCRWLRHMYPREWGVCCPGRRRKVPQTANSKGHVEKPGVKLALRWSSDLFGLVHVPALTHVHIKHRPSLPSFRAVEIVLGILGSDSQTSQHPISFAVDGCLQSDFPTSGSSAPWKTIIFNMQKWNHVTIANIFFYGK